MASVCTTCRPAPPCGSWTRRSTTRLRQNELSVILRRISFTGVTPFKPEGDSPAEWCLNILDMVDLHHPRLREVRVMGTQIDEKLEGAFGKLGFTAVEPTDDGLAAFWETELG